MNIRVLINILLVRLNIRKVLPKEAVRRVRVVECGEPIVAVSGTDFILLGDEAFAYGRTGLIAKLYQVDEALHKEGYRLGIYEVLRDQDTQLSRRNSEYAIIRSQHPEYDEAKVQSVLDSRVSNITGSDTGGHQTGGAIDCTLCAPDGSPLDMGTEYLGFNHRTITDSPDLTTEQKRNRDILCRVMRNAGFVNFPNEWWHFSYGDKMWAAYSYK
ncbi:MAG: hypothetical protein K2H74_03660, partial [Paramuribaculum sp.]|nr:hypothetical protein [Paramuribaculum sp.]